MVVYYLKDQGDYDATYSFTDEDNGESSPTGWTNNDPASAWGYTEVADNANGHRKCIRTHVNIISGANFPQIYQTFTAGAQSYGTIEFYLRADDCTIAGTDTKIKDSADNLIAGISLDGDLIYYYDSIGGWTDTGHAAPTDGQWYHVSLVFEATAGGYNPFGDGALAQWKYRLYIDDVKYGDYSFNNNSSPDKLVLETQLTPNPHNDNEYAWWDAIGYSWDTGYSIGDNKSLVGNTDISTSIDEFLISHPIKDYIKGKGSIFGQTIRNDDIILITDITSHWWNAHPLQNGLIYKDSLAFRSDTLGSAPSDTSQGTWTDNSGGSTDAFIIDKYNGHAYVLQLEDYDGADSAEIDFAITSGQSSGSIEFKIATTDPTYESSFRIYDEGSGLAAGIKIDADHFYYYDDNSAWTDFADTDPVIGKWYSCIITFDCSDDSLSYTIVDDDGTAIASQGSLTMDSSPTTIDAFKIITQDGDSNYLVFIDAIGFTWDTDYILGDNMLLDVTLDSQTIFEGRVILEDNRYVQNLDISALSVELEENPPGYDGNYNPDGYSGIASNYTEEVASEIIEDKCSSVTATKSDMIHRATYSFENEADNGNPYGLVIDEGGGSIYVDADETPAASGHKGVLCLSDTNAADDVSVKWFIESRTYGSIEWYWGSSDVTFGSYLRIYSGATRVMEMLIDSDKFQYYDGAWHDVGLGATDDTLYHMRLSRECTTGKYESLAQYDWHISINGTDYGDYDFANNVASVDQIRFESFSGDSNYIQYIDAMGFSWDDDYTTASDSTDEDTYQNSHIYIEHFEYGGGTTIDLSLNGEYTIKRPLDMISGTDTFIWLVRGDHKLIYTEGIKDSQIDVATGEWWDCDGYNMIERYNTVLTMGGFSGGVRQTGTATDTNAVSTFGPKLIKRFYAGITSSTTLDTLASSILTLQSNVPKIVTMKYRNVNYGMLLPGQAITIPASTVIYSKSNSTYVDSGQWIIISNAYDTRRSINNLTLANALYFEYDWNLTEELEFLINQ